MASLSSTFMHALRRSRWMRIGLVLMAAGAVVATAAPRAIAMIVAVQPDIVLSAPASVVLNATESDIEIIGFNERQCFTLSQDLTTDTNVIPADPWNVVSSHFFHSDPITGSLLTGRARFDGPVIGVISSSALLDASDAECGRPGVAYPAPGTEPFRGLEAFQANDAYNIIAGGNGIAISMDVPSYSDQIRVITCCPGYNCDPQ